MVRFQVGPPQNQAVTLNRSCFFVEVAIQVAIQKTKFPPFWRYNPPTFTASIHQQKTPPLRAGSHKRILFTWLFIFVRCGTPCGLNVVLGCPTLSLNPNHGTSRKITPVVQVTIAAITLLILVTIPRPPPQLYFFLKMALKETANQKTLDAKKKNGSVYTNSQNSHNLTFFCSTVS